VNQAGWSVFYGKITGSSSGELYTPTSMARAGAPSEPTSFRGKQYSE
jgi:hypothetical protein